MRTAILLLALAPAWLAPVAACAAPRYAASAQELDRRGAIQLAAVDADDCAKPKTWAVRQACKAAEARREAAADACAKVKGSSARRACRRKAEAPDPPAPVMRTTTVDADDCAKLRSRTARRACARKAAAEVAETAAAKRGADRREDCARLRGASAREACRRRLDAPAPTAQARRPSAPDPRFPAAPPPVRRTGAAPARPAEIIVEDGDSAFDIAARFGVSVRALAELNALEAPYDAPPGMTLRIPPRTAATAAASPPAAPRTVAARPEPVESARPYASLPTSPAPALPSPTTSRRGARTEADALAAVAVAAARAPPPLPADAGRGRFMWPVRSEVLSGYGPKGPGLRNDGVDLAVRAGDSVRAAADGEVVYAGKEIAAFGNLVLLKHAGGWVTAYAHLGRITVAMRQTVAQGQAIGEGGASGAVETPRLHFEVRAPSAGGAKPVDPATVLPPL